MNVTITVANPAELLAALKSAKAGEVIGCAPGIYADFRIRGFKTPGVTITSADPANQAVFADLNLQDSANITFTGLLFDGQTQKETFGWMVTGCENITFDGIEFRDAIEGDPQGTDQGLKVSQCKVVTVVDCEFHHLYRGLICDNIEGLTVVGNDFHDMARTAMYSVNIVGGLFAENYIADAYPAGDDHMDAMSFNVNTFPNLTRDIVVRDNLARRGKGGKTQGIVFASKIEGNPFRNIKILRNQLLGLGMNGILYQQVKGGELTGNAVRRYPGRAENSLANVLNSSDVIVGGNTAQSFAVAQAANNNTAYIELPPAKAPADVPDLTTAEEAAIAAEWLSQFRPGVIEPEAPVEPEPPARDDLRESIALRTEAKLEPLKRSGRLIVNFKTPAQGEAALAAVLAVEN